MRKRQKAMRTMILGAAMGGTLLATGSCDFALDGVSVIFDDGPYCCGDGYVEFYYEEYPPYYYEEEFFFFP